MFLFPLNKNSFRIKYVTTFNFKLHIKLPVTRENDHIYLQSEEASSILFTWAKLLKSHRGYLHPANDKVLNLLQLESLNDVKCWKKEITGRYFKKSYEPRTLRSIIYSFCGGFCTSRKCCVWEQIILLI